MIFASLPRRTTGGSALRRVFLQRIGPAAARLSAARLGLAWLLCLAMLAPALAHGQLPPGGSKAGLPIPSVSHGQMKVLSDYRGAIMELAAAQEPVDDELLRLRSFVSLQHFYCLWGLVPGSLRDESSPFNECTHAYLAGARALLLHLQVMSGDRSAVRALSRRIDLEMLDNKASLMTCRFSDEPFNTADVVIPTWRDVAVYGPALLCVAILAFAAAGCGWLLGRRGLSRARVAPSP